MDMNLNATFIRNMREYGIPVDLIGTAIFVLIAMDKERYDLLDALDDNNKEQRLMMLYRTLLRKGFIIETGEESAVLYSIEPLGYDFLNYVYTELGTSELVPETVEVVEESIEQIKNDTVADWILEYVNIFPKGMIEGKRLRVSSVECIPRMEKFINQYGHSKDTILAATRQYLEDEQGGRKLTRNAKYFIYKNDDEKGYISDLLTYCERVQDDIANPVKAKVNRDII